MEQLEKNTYLIEIYFYLYDIYDKRNKKILLTLLVVNVRKFKLQITIQVNVNLLQI